MRSSTDSPFTVGWCKGIEVQGIRSGMVPIITSSSDIDGRLVPSNQLHDFTHDLRPLQIHVLLPKHELHVSLSLGRL